jgi:hypothetical protein
MNKLLFVFVVALSTLLISCNSEPEKKTNEDLKEDSEKLEKGEAHDPITYNDGIVGLQVKTMERMIAFQSMTAEEMQAELAPMAAELDESIATLEKLVAIPGGEDLRLSALDLFKFYKGMVTEELTELVAILLKGEENITEEDMTRIDELANAMGEKEVPFDEAFQTAQQAFAKANNMMLQENELQKEIDNM